MSEVAVQRATAQASRLYTSRGFRGAYVAGAKAKVAGKTADTCPYKRRRGGGWQAWRRAWLRGFQSVED